MQDPAVTGSSVKLIRNWHHKHRKCRIVYETGLDSFSKRDFVNAGYFCSRILSNIDKKFVSLTEKRSHCMKNWFRLILESGFLKALCRCSRILCKFDQKLVSLAQERFHCIRNWFRVIFEK